MVVALKVGDVVKAPATLINTLMSRVPTHDMKLLYQQEIKHFLLIICVYEVI